MRLERELPVKYHADVFIAGGGPAGVAAAVTAARQGKRVFLAEEQGAFGGCGTVGLVPELMNFDDGAHLLSDGFGREVCEALYPVLPSGRRCPTVKVERMKRLYDRLMVESGAEFSFFTKLVDVVAENGRIRGVVLSAKQGLFAVTADVYIDCTGDGTLSALAGAEFELGGDTGRTMPATLCSLWANVDFAARDGRDDRMIMEAIREGVIPQFDPLLPGIKECDRENGIGGGNVGHCFGVDPTDERSLTKAMLEGRELVLCYDRYFRERLKAGYERLTLIETANILGVRESRRIMGDKMLKKEHFFSQAVFEDEIGRYSYPIDIHNETPDQEGIDNFNKNISCAHGVGESYGIPYGALCPRGIENLLVAGKCISADRAMQASVRVIPGCYITGQAAGMAAAITEKGDVHGVDVRALQQRLLAVGAYLPNAK